MVTINNRSEERDLGLVTDVETPIVHADRRAIRVDSENDNARARYGELEALHPIELASGLIHQVVRADHIVHRPTFVFARH